MSPSLAPPPPSLLCICSSALFSPAPTASGKPLPQLGVVILSKRPGAAAQRRNGCRLTSTPRLVGPSMSGSRRRRVQPGLGQFSGPRLPGGQKKPSETGLSVPRPADNRGLNVSRDTTATTRVLPAEGNHCKVVTMVTPEQFLSHRALQAWPLNVDPTFDLLHSAT